METQIPSRLDRLPWSGWHWTVLLGLGAVWVLDGLEVTIVGAVGSTLTKSGSGIAISTAQVGTAAGIYVAGACAGALFFGHLTDRLGRKRLFLVTLSVYLVATVLTALSRSAWIFFLFRFFTGAGIGGEYAAINSAIDELIPARVRGTVDLLVNGSYWLGTAAGAVATLVLLDPQLIALNVGWRLCFFLGASLGLGVLFVRRSLPESPRWLLTHGRAEQADRVVDGIEREVSRTTGQLLPPGESMTIHPNRSVGILDVARTVFARYPRRSMLGLALFVGQAFLYNAVFFTYALTLTTFYNVSTSSVGYYIVAFAVGNFLGPLVLGRLFDVIGRRAMISMCYLLSGAMLAVTAWLFDQGILSATTQTVAWVVIFFFASAGASAAYLTVSEIFPMETRALAIAIFYAVGTGLGGIIGPILFGHLVATKKPAAMAVGYLIAGGVMLAAGVVEIILGVDAEQKSLEQVAAPLTAEGTTEEGADREAGDKGTAHEDLGLHTPPARRIGRHAWSPIPQSSTYPGENPYLAPEVDRVVAALVQIGHPASAGTLSSHVGGRFWGPGRLRQALRSGVASGRLLRIGRDLYTVASSEQRSPFPADPEAPRSDSFR